MSPTAFYSHSHPPVCTVAASMPFQSPTGGGLLSSYTPLTTMSQPVQDDVLSILSECFSDSSSVISSSQLGDLVGYSQSSLPVAQSAPTPTKTAEYAKVANWVHNGFSCKVSPETILNNLQTQQYKNAHGIQRIAVMLAKQCFFGERNLCVSTITGRNVNPLDTAKLSSLKSLIKGALPQVSQLPAEFEKVWSKCKKSICDLCKRLRSQARQYDFLSMASNFEGVPMPSVDYCYCYSYN